MKRRRWRRCRSAALSLSSLAREPDVDRLKRWGLRTLGDLAAIPSADLSERLGQDGLRWQRWARGEDARPLVPAGVGGALRRIARFGMADRGARAAVVRARAVVRSALRAARAARSRGGRAACHVEAGDTRSCTSGRCSCRRRCAMRGCCARWRCSIWKRIRRRRRSIASRLRVDVTEGRVLQFGLFARALPAEKLATLLARLGALMGSDRVGAPALVDSYRPGAFAMTDFAPEPTQRNWLQAPGSRLRARPARSQSRRVRSPSVRASHPAVSRCRFRRASRSSKGGPCASPPIGAASAAARWSGATGRGARPATGGSPPLTPRPSPLAPCIPPLPRSWNCDEWDVVLSDGVSYRISQARQENTWFIDGMLD